MIDLNNTWLELSEGSYCKLLDLGYKPKEFDYKHNECDGILIKDKMFCPIHIKDINSNLQYKQIKLNENYEFEYVEEEDDTAETEVEENEKRMGANDTMVNPHCPSNFGFEPKEGVEIYFKDNHECYIGMVDWIKDIPSVTKKKQTCWFDKDGKCFVILKSAIIEVAAYNLTPIKKPWYEDESNFPCVVKNKKNRKYYIAYSCNGKTFNLGSYDSGMENYDKAEKEEVLSLYVDE